MYSVFEVQMSTMIRKQIYLQKRQNTLLKKVAEARQTSEAEIIRQALERELSGGNVKQVQVSEEAWTKALAFMQGLREQGPLGGQPRDWKREDLYEERLSRYDRDPS
jgi:hypothetical protein